MQIQLGTVLFVGSVKGRGGHGAFVTVEKINKKSFAGTEQKGSYTPGTQWRIHKEATYAVVGQDSIGRMTMTWMNDN